ncbi:MAG: Rrf2 family transcriptional regulator [Gemmatimonadaceae bacterium]
MNTRFAVAVHILTLLESQKGEPATSELVASSVGTNPSLIRRLMGRLIKAGLASAKRGVGGGAVLGRPANQIRLLDVHRAIDEDAGVIPIHQTPSPKCPVGRNIARALEGRFEAVEQAMYDELARTTIADLASDLSRRNQLRRARA